MFMATLYNKDSYAVENFAHIKSDDTESLKKVFKHLTRADALDYTQPTPGVPKYNVNAVYYDDNNSQWEQGHIVMVKPIEFLC